MDSVANVVGSESDHRFYSDIQPACFWPLRRSLRPRFAVRDSLDAVIREQITYRQRRALAWIGIMAGGHLDGGMPELSAPGENAVLFDNGVAEKFAQFMHFLPRRDAVRLQPADQNLPVRFTPIAHVFGSLPFPVGTHHKESWRLLLETEQFFHERGINIDRTA